MPEVTSSCLLLAMFIARIPGLELNHDPFQLSSRARTVNYTQRFTSSSVKHPVIKCDHFCCNCNGPVASCTGQNRTLAYLPRLPSEIRDFRMMRASLYNLTRQMMANLSNFELRVVNLTFNKIYKIAFDAFYDFPKMEVLDLSGNFIPVLELQNSLNSISRKFIRTIALGKMDWNFVPEDLFHVFFNLTFRKVDLEQNSLEVFNNAVFSPFLRVDTVDLSKNNIHKVNMTSKANINKLVLKENNFVEFPDLCLQENSAVANGSGSSSAFPNLLSIYISQNPFRRIDPKALRGACFPRLQKLDISWSFTLLKLEDNTFADLPKLENLMVNNMIQIQRYERFAFNSSSLRVLSLCQNPRLSKTEMDIEHVFRYCPNLEELSIVDTKLQMDFREIWLFLEPLKSIKYLNLQRIRRGILPYDLLWRLPHLKTLVFTGNNMIAEVLGRALVNVTSLQELNVQANRITVVNETILPWEFRKNLTWLDISLNPFTCTCNLLWFRRWIDDVKKNGSVKVHNFPSREYRCNTPAEMKNKNLGDFHPTEEGCAIKNPLVLIYITGGCLLTGMVLGAVLIYRYRWHLRFYLYRLRRRRYYTQIPGSLISEDGNAVQFFRFDAYLAHSSHDLDWINEELLPLVEGEQGLKMFLEERDSLPGTVLVDSITRYMDESARVLLVISDHYNREGWRQCEFEHILYAAIEQDKDVIIVLLGDVEAGRMTKDMRRMLTRGTFLQWGSSEEARRVFRNGMKVALKTQNINLHSLC